LIFPSAYLKVEDCTNVFQTIHYSNPGGGSGCSWEKKKKKKRFHDKPGCLLLLQAVTPYICTISTIDMFEKREEREN
jgi:hypothetical protein